jgi:ATP-binding cassette subfamily C protein CydD
MNIHRKLFGFSRNVSGFLPGLSALSLLIASTVILQMYLISQCISMVFINSETPEHTTYVILLIVIFIRAALVFWRERFSQTKSVDIKSSIRSSLLHHLFHHNDIFSKKENTGELVAVVAEGVEKLDDYYAKYIPAILHLLVFSTILLVFTFIYDPLSGIVLLVTGPLILFLMWMIGTHAKTITQRQWESFEELSGYFLDVLQGLKTLKVFVAEKRESQRVFNASNSLRVLTMKVLRVAFMSGFVLELAASLSIAIVALQVSIRLIEGLMIFETGLLILLLAPEFYLPFRALGSHHHAGMEGSAAGEKIFDTGLRHAKLEPKQEMRFDRKPQITVEFKNVGYTYNMETRFALSNVSCALKPGSLTALVGPTGSGKSTFAKLLLKFLNPTQGAIFVNGASLESIRNAQWWENLAYVAQDPHFFNGTILDNLVAANKGAGIEHICEAARLAGIHEFILNLPNGYHELIFDNASGLSAGEKQRLAIARAFIKDSPLLVLDEPSSNLDPQSEILIAKATQPLVRDRTTLVIAHRLRTVIQANQILVFDKGQIAESGTHDELIKQKGIYAGFFET